MFSDFGINLSGGVVFSLFLLELMSSLNYLVLGLGTLSPKGLIRELKHKESWSRFTVSAKKNQ